MAVEKPTVIEYVKGASQQKRYSSRDARPSSNALALRDKVEQGIAKFKKNAARSSSAPAPAASPSSERSRPTRPRSPAPSSTRKRSRSLSRRTSASKKTRASSSQQGRAKGRFNFSEKLEKAADSDDMEEDGDGDGSEQEPEEQGAKEKELEPFVELKGKMAISKFLSAKTKFGTQFKERLTSMGVYKKGDLFGASDKTWRKVQGCDLEGIDYEAAKLALSDAVKTCKSECDDIKKYNQKMNLVDCQAKAIKSIDTLKGAQADFDECIAAMQHIKSDVQAVAAEASRKKYAALNKVAKMFEQHKTAEPLAKAFAATLLDAQDIWGEKERMRPTWVGSNFFLKLRYIIALYLHINNEFKTSFSPGGPLCRAHGAMGHGATVWASTSSGDAPS